jgi:pimeloyl-ACP methyl ester carboxylesterase
LSDRVRPAEGFVEARGAKLRVRDAGTGPAVVLLHGWAFDLDIWQLQTEALASGYRVICFDRRGFGFSTGDPSVLDDVFDLLALLDRFEVGRAAFVGASQAARVVLRAAIAAPERCACLVIDGAPDVVNEGDRSLTTKDVPIALYRALAQSGDLDAVRDGWEHHPLAQLRTQDAAIRARLCQIVRRYPGRDLLRPSPAQLPPLGPRLPEITAPALVINGEGDAPIRIAAGELIALTLPRARRVVVPGAGHLPNLDQPGFYNDLLVQFFKEFLDATN